MTKVLLVDDGHGNIEQATKKLCREPSRDVNRFCNYCGHVHEGFNECGVEMGPNRICHCEREAVEK